MKMDFMKTGNYFGRAYLSRVSEKHKFINLLDD
jgi:hypothetical protein